MSRPSAFRFRTQMIALIVAAIGMTVVIGYGGLTAFGEWQTQDLTAKLSPDARRASVALEANRVPDESALKALIAESAALQREGMDGQYLALAILTLIAAACGAATGAVFATRFSHPVEEVARAARAIAAGDLTARPAVLNRGSGETAQLVSDFICMAENLEKAERELRESSAAIAHELRTPLTVLRGRLQGISDGVFAAGPNEIGGLIRHVESLAAIVDDLRVVSLAAVGALELRLTEIDLGAEMAVVANSFAPDIEARGMRLELSISPTVMRADAARMRQAAVALIENALRYASDGGVVRIETESRGDGAVLRVLDRGAGFAESDLPRVFDRFWRADPSRSRDVGGSGLGLSVVRAIAMAHGGTCIASNRDCGGACLELRVPAPAGPV